MEENDALDEALLQEIFEEKWPNDELPTLKKLIEVLRNPQPGDSLFLQYLEKRPGLKKFLQECL